MHVCILSTASTLPLSDNLTEVQNFGSTTILTGAGWDQVMGDHIMIEGEEDDILAWFSLNQTVWVGQGQPFEERFALLTFED